MCIKSEWTFSVGNNCVKWIVKNKGRCKLFHVVHCSNVSSFVNCTLFVPKELFIYLLNVYILFCPKELQSGQIFQITVKCLNLQTTWIMSVENLLEWCSYISTSYFQLFLENILQFKGMTTLFWQLVRLFVFALRYRFAGYMQ